MNDKLKNIGIAYNISLISLLLLTLLSLVAYKERTMFVDSSFFMLNILSKKTFFFTEFRLGAFITQIGVLGASYLGMSLKSILMIFSVGFYLFYIAAVLIIGLRWKQKQFAILLCLYLILFISDGYFCTVGEIFQGITWMFLFFALYFNQQKPNRWFSHVLLCSFAFLGLVCHMIMLFPFAFLWLYLNLDNSPLKALWKDKKFWIYSVVLLGLGFMRYKISNSGWYDSMKLSHVHDMSVSSVVNAFTSGHAITFAKLLLHNYWVIIPILLVGFVLLIKDKKFMQLGLVLLFGLAYFVLVCVVYPDAYDRNMLFYYENEWAPLAIILATPFVMQIFDVLKSKKLVLGIFAVIVAVRLFYIFDAYQFYHHRFENLDAVTTKLHEQGINKALIVADEKTANKDFVMTWGTPTESMLLSSVKQYDPLVTFKIVDKNFEIRPIADSFHACFNVLPNSFLNRHYFNIDSTAEYKVFEGLEQFATRSNLKHYK